MQRAAPRVASQDRLRVLLIAGSVVPLLSLGLGAGTVEAYEGRICAGAFPASGQTTSYASSTQTTTGAPVHDDGAEQQGGPLIYRDNGDGTITDLNTLLMWEKKSQDGSLHDVNLTFAWSSSTTPTIWDWLAQVNAENGVGFAGYNDWRIPNVKELQSILNYELLEPAVTPAFNNGDGPGCTVLQCSTTAVAGYWASTTSAKYSGTYAWVVFFFGDVNTDVKGNAYYVRAVRGGCMPY